MSSTNNNIVRETIVENIADWFVNNDSPVNDVAPDSWKELAKKQITDDLNNLFDSFENSFDKFVDWFNSGDPQTQPLPKPEDFLYPPDDSDLGFRRPPPDVNDNWKNGKNWTPPRVDPLVLDLDGDGIETLGVNATTHVLFDHNNDGLKTGTGWIAGDDGFLVLDRDGNGTIDNGGELFGDQTLVDGIKGFNGFGALWGEDSNNDFVFDANDSNFTAVRVWQDTNSDGISQTSELHTLTELGTPQGGLSCFAIHLLTSIDLTSMAFNNQNFKNIRRVA